MGLLLANLVTPQREAALAASSSGGPARAKHCAEHAATPSSGGASCRPGLTSLGAAPLPPPTEGANAGARVLLQLPSVGARELSRSTVAAATTSAAAAAPARDATATATATDADAADTDAVAARGGAVPAPHALSDAVTSLHCATFESYLVWCKHVDTRPLCAAASAAPERGLLNPNANPSPNPNPNPSPNQP